jgi:MFS family permease
MCPSFWFAPMTLASVAGAVLAGRTTHRFGPRPVALVGQLLVAGSLVVMALAVAIWNSFGLVITGMVAGETGFMLSSVALTILATTSLDDQHAGLAAGLINTSTQLGGGFGLGIVATVVAVTSAQATIAETSITAGFVTCLAFVVPALILSTSVSRLKYALDILRGS